MQINRLASIDSLRAFTMLLMIWVNDFWSLKGIPKWLQHANYGEDYLGFSDIIFPLFLFLVGLSIPLAIDHRLQKGHSTASVSKHIISRSIALIVIGLFMVNYETIHDQSIPVTRLWYCLLLSLAVLLVWMDWNTSPLNKRWGQVLKISGIGLLIFLAAIYRGGEQGEFWMTKQWWGILGLIGWAYLASALGCLYSKNKLSINLILFFTFFILCFLQFSIEMPSLPNSLSFLNVMYSGRTIAITLAGVCTTMALRTSPKRERLTLLSLTILGITFVVLGLLIRPIWGISKISGTPPYMSICIGISLLAYLSFYLLIDKMKLGNWLRPIKAAGTATFMCYMLPYLAYPILAFISIKLPEDYYTGILGLINSMLFALTIILITQYLENQHFKLKL